MQFQNLKETASPSGGECNDYIIVFVLFLRTLHVS